MFGFAIIIIMLLLSAYIYVKGFRAFKQISPGAAKIFSYIYIPSVIIILFAYKFQIYLFVIKYGYLMFDFINYWLIGILYMTILYLILDTVLLFKRDLHINRLKILGTFTAMTIILLSIGVYNFRHFKTIEYDITLGTIAPGENNRVRIAFASDIHLGNSVSKKHLKNYVQAINEQKPDIVLLGGDNIDQALFLLKRNNSGEPFLDLNAPSGVYAIMGNHDYYHGDTDSLNNYYKSLNINMLRDSITRINLYTGTQVYDSGPDTLSFYLVGREDLRNASRIPLKELLLKREDPSLPTIVMDHRPDNFQEAVDSDVELQLSGHTHDGQFWPNTWLVRLSYKYPYGYHILNNTNLIVSSGLGLWGPKLRIGSKSEIVIVNLNF